MKNDYLKVLDISFNSLGNQDNFYELSSGRNLISPIKESQSKNSDCLEQILKFITQSQYLVHLDISNNKFSNNEIERLMESLV